MSIKKVKDSKAMSNAPFSKGEELLIILGAHGGKKLWLTLLSRLQKNKVPHSNVFKQFVEKFIFTEGELYFCGKKWGTNSDLTVQLVGRVKNIC